jgi:folate-dependent phosphoribosylglycinamide formyltransferase PurN
MPSSLKSSVLLPSQGVELVTLVSGLGTEMQLYLAISDSANRQTNIDAALALLDSNDAAVIAYAATHGLPAPTATP